MNPQDFLLNITEKTRYQTIEEMPIWNWNKILETGELKHLFKTGKGRVSENVYELWMNLQDQYIQEFGLDESFKKQLKLLKDKARLNYEFILTKDRFINTQLAIVEADLNVINQMESLSFYQIKDHLEKYKGYKIDPKKTSVIEWFTTLKNMSDNGKAD